MWTGCDLGAIYEALLDDDARRRDGIYYTPAPIVDRILDATLDPLIAAALAAPDPAAALGAIRLLDPACGGGYFLVAAAERIAGALAALPAAALAGRAPLCIAARCLYGADSDPVALDLVRYSFALLAAPDTPAPHLFEGDALGPLPAGWARFDAVAGNPPYVANRSQPPAQKAAHRARYVTARGQYDLAVLFVERGLALLRAGGRLGYILPNKFMAADYGAPLRALLAERTTLLRVDDASGAAPFPGAAAYPVILVARNEPAPAGAQVCLSPAQGAPASVPQDAFFGLDAQIMPAAATTELLALARQVARQPGRLPAGAIGCGVARAGHSRAAIPAAAYAALPASEQAGYRPLLQTQAVGAYRVCLPAAPRYLPQAIAGAAGWAACDQPKVLVPGIARRLRAAHTPGGAVLGRVYYVKTGAAPYPPFYLLALLNSRLLAWYYRFLYWPVHLAGGYLRFNAPYLARLPLPLPDADPLAATTLASLAAELAAGTHADSAVAQDAVDAAVCRLYAVPLAALADAEAALAALTA